MFEPVQMIVQPDPQNNSYSQFEVEQAQTKRSEVLVHDSEVYTEGMHMTGEAKLTKKTSQVNTPHRKTKNSSKGSHENADLMPVITKKGKSKASQGSRR